MKTILSLVVLSFLSLTVSAAPKPKRGPSNISDSDKIYVCKSTTAAKVKYVVNVTDGVIETYENDGDLANGLPKKLGELTGLDVEKIEGTRLSKKTKKGQTSYVLYKTAKIGGFKGKTAVMEIEMEKDMDFRYVTHADAKLMGVRISDTNDVDENVSCKRNIN